MASYGPQPGWVVAPADGWVAPKGRTPDGRAVAPEGRRVIGYLIDMAIWSVPQLLVLGVLVAEVLSNFSDFGDPSGDAAEDPSSAFSPLVVLLYLLLFVLGILRLAVEAELVARRGQTWGMRAARLRAVDGRTGGPVPRGRAWGRAAFAAYISSQLFGLGFWWAFFDDRNRTLHDLVCTTVVVDERV